MTLWELRRALKKACSDLEFLKCDVWNQREFIRELTREIKRREVKRRPRKAAVRQAQSRDQGRKRKAQ